jgi:hypothetical protein
MFSPLNAPNDRHRLHISTARRTWASAADVNAPGTRHSSPRAGTVAGTGSGTGCPAIAGAKLRLTVGATANDNSDKGGEFRAAVSSSWSESSVTWNTAPAATVAPQLQVQCA